MALSPELTGFSKLNDTWKSRKPVHIRQIQVAPMELIVSQRFVATNGMPLTGLSFSRH